MQNGRYRKMEWDNMIWELLLIFGLDKLILAGMSLHFYKITEILY